MLGRMRHRLTIQAESEAADGGGGYTLTWSDVATRWGNILPLRGDERLQADQLEDRVSHKIKLRYYSGLTAKHRIKYGTRVFQIRAVINPDERGRFHELLVEEGVAT